MLRIENLLVAYGDNIVLKNLRIQFAEGEIHGVLGMNGTGKTTFFNTLYGFVPSQQGQCLYQDQPVQNRSIAYLETHNYFYPYMNGREYLRLLSLSNPDFAIDEWNLIFDLPLEVLVENYSTGMKKKLAFLGMLALDRPILILDEPFNGVDIESNEKIYQILKRIKGQGKIILLSSHIISSLTGICDRISYLSGGHFARTYLREEYAELELLIKELVRQQIDPTLDRLMEG
ncbi:MAG: ATP-binding cassette domain-containing protein [Bacteroidota bacterium]